MKLWFDDVTAWEFDVEGQTAIFIGDFGNETVKIVWQGEAALEAIASWEEYLKEVPGDMTCDIFIPPAVVDRIRNHAILEANGRAS